MPVRCFLVNEVFAFLIFMSCKEYDMNCFKKLLAEYFTESLGGDAEFDAQRLKEIIQSAKR